ncbi:MAG: hypothetical protein E6H00_05060 [Bacillati bacterium ANGP1]|uniref:Uncharacterized protein n=1 Tax=Candidatus Segetimicrobium genomatis TaxID=2569760 RepID=A0A537K5L0_9BACT|nr:MAG: hypothetical protein E6H00_05060 [Terrabacteria group bacterium ANGP1]
MRLAHWVGVFLDVSVVHGQHNGARCFKCPKVRRQNDAGWYFVELQESWKVAGPSRMYVCPDDYLKFAAAERRRWNPVLDGSGESQEQAPPHEPAKDAVQDGANHTAPPQAPARTVDELVTLLTKRGLSGWAFLVRDVAAGRVRRVHLRQLPAEREVRDALLAYLHSAGAVVTVSRHFLHADQRVRQGE